MLIEQCGLVVVYLFKDSPHECFPYQPASIAHVIPVAEAIQHPHLAVIKHNGDSMFARLFFHR